jgi:hypothetical protein
MSAQFKYQLYRVISNQLTHGHFTPPKLMEWTEILSRTTFICNSQRKILTHVLNVILETSLNMMTIIVEVFQLTKYTISSLYMTTMIVELLQITKYTGCLL